MSQLTSPSPGDILTASAFVLYYVRYLTYYCKEFHMKKTIVLAFLLALTSSVAIAERIGGGGPNAAVVACEDGSFWENLFCKIFG